MRELKRFETTSEIYLYAVRDDLKCNLSTFQTLINKMENFQDFYKRQKDKLFSYLMRVTGDYHLAMDIMQESFLRCLDKYSDKAVNISLLYKIARNVMIDNSRKNKRKREYEQDAAGIQAEAKTDHQVRQEYRRVLAAMKSLAPDERDILSLAITENLKYREIAGIMGIKESSVKVKVHRARTKLKEALKKGELS